MRGMSYSEGPILLPSLVRSGRSRTLEADSESFSNAGCRTSQITERFRAWPMALGGVEKRHRCLFRTAPERFGHRTICLGRCNQQSLQTAARRARSSGGGLGSDTEPPIFVDVLDRCRLRNDGNCCPGTSPVDSGDIPLIRLHIERTGRRRCQRIRTRQHIRSAGRFS